MSGLILRFRSACALGTAGHVDNVADGGRLLRISARAVRTFLDERSRGLQALAGVGCHYMAGWMDRETSGLTQMGAEGVDWIGQAPFTSVPHVFQNMGEGTYFHSGYLAIRQAIAARANVTYKILFNDAVAMTGGQPVDGQISVPQIVRQMASEGAAKIVVVTDEPIAMPALLWSREFRSRPPRSRLVQRELREIKGVTVLVYDQTCAAEKRRRRKKGTFPDPDRRMVINSDVCEGCGDCGKASNCLSIVPFETELGRKRAIDQTSCNKDFSCVEGFCPSFVSVIGGKLRKQAATAQDWIALAKALPLPSLAPVEHRPHNLLIAGVGGSGIITVGAIVAMAAHLDGREVAELDFTALAQKGGSVMCHLRIASRGTAIKQPRIDWGEAHGVIMGDLIVGCLPDNLGVIRKGSTQVLVNTHIGSTAEFTRDPDTDPHAADLFAKVTHAAGDDRTVAFDAQAVAKERFGDTTGVNMLLVGHAWQQGLIPVSEEAMLQAIMLNGVAVEANKQAFASGRVLAARGLDQREAPSAEPLSAEPLAALIEKQAALLTDYQNASCAAGYRRFVEECAAAEHRALGNACQAVFAKAVAKSLFKLMAYKDEYEVAQLYSRPEFMESIRRQFDGDISLRIHLAPPFLARPRKGQNVPEKITFGPWMMRAFSILARLRFLRGTAFDPFGYTADRRLERQLIADYRAMVAGLLPSLSARTLNTAIRLALLPETMRGFGHVKQANVDKAKLEQARLLEEFATLSQPMLSAIRNIA